MELPPWLALSLADVLEEGEAGWVADESLELWRGVLEADSCVFSEAAGLELVAALPPADTWSSGNLGIGVRLRFGRFLASLATDFTLAPS